MFRPSLPAVTAPTWTPSSIFSPCLVNAFCASLAIVSSTAPRKVGSASSTVTSEPRRRHTEPISSPMTPEPISPRRLGTDGIRSAPSFDRMFSSSNGAPGSARGFEPVATITCLARMLSSAAPATLIS
jgi:hypothetical protein